MNLEKAKAFMFTAVGILALVVAFWLGGQSVQTAKAAEDRNVVGIGGSSSVLLDNGEIWYWDATNEIWRHFCTWEGPVSARESDWSQIKSSFGK